MASFEINALHTVSGLNVFCDLFNKAMCNLQKQLFLFFFFSHTIQIMLSCIIDERDLEKNYCGGT